MSLDLSSWAPIAGKLISLGAPVLGEAIGGPFGSMIGNTIGSIVANELGVPATPEAVGSALNSPDAQAKVTEIEARNKEHITALEASLQDMQDARSMTEEFAKEGSVLQYGSAIVSTLVVMSFLMSCVLTLILRVPETALVTMLLGYLAAKFSTVVDFWVGSSNDAKQMSLTAATKGK